MENFEITQRESEKKKLNSYFDLVLIDNLEKFFSGILVKT